MYYQSIPKRTAGASAIDENEIQHFFQIMMPGVIVGVALWSFVRMWNSYFDAMIYLNDVNTDHLSDEHVLHIANCLTQREIKRLRILSS